MEPLRCNSGTSDAPLWGKIGEKRMPANVETMAYAKFSERDVPWHKLGTPIDHFMTSKEALVAAGLDWEVVFRPIHVDGVLVPGRFATVRFTDKKILGVTSERYQIIQNKDAFDFVDNLIGTGAVVYDTAGCIDNGYNVKTWMNAKMDGVTVMGDKIIPYLVMVNSFDGKSKVKVCITPTRVVCNNTLTLALDTAPRTWSTCHTGDIQSKIDEARLTLELTGTYMHEFAVEAEAMAAKNLYDVEVLHFLDDLFAVPKDSGKRTIANADKVADAVFDVYTMAPDLKKFAGTAWGLYGAVVDVIDHTDPIRKTQTFNANRFIDVANGHAVIGRAQTLLAAIAA
jgi:phage/plasmid-like protein (TIGR03299 family)